jgi:hypothetical protein
LQHDTTSIFPPIKHNKRFITQSSISGIKKFSNIDRQYSQTHRFWSQYVQKYRIWFAEHQQTDGSSHSINPNLKFCYIQQGYIQKSHYFYLRLRTSCQ